ncbi:MAG: hypothetical protein E7596_06370 [Ruminococcaceae bacterium]|nr:hypothetical protein [Oscillospiraceae bacterium]
MKRFFGIVVLALMLSVSALSFTACSNKSDVNGAISKTKALTFIDASVYTKISVNAGNGADSYELVEDILVSGDKVQLTVGEYGIKGDTVYMDKEYVYTKGENGYTKSSLEEYTKKNGAYNEKINGILQKLPSDFFEDADISKTGKKLNMEKGIDGEMLSSTFGDLLALLQKELNITVDDKTETKYEDCKLTLTVKDGYITDISLKYNMLFTASKKKGTANVKIALVLNNPGSEVTVNIPQ